MIRSSILPVLLLLCAAPVAIAVDLPQLTVKASYGVKVYRAVTIVGPVKGGIKITHADGISVIPLAALPLEWQKKFPPEAAPAPAPAPASATTPDKAGTAPAPAADPSAADPIASTILITGSNKVSGTGFVVQVADKQYLYTAAHVLTGLEKPKFVTGTGEPIVMTPMNTVEVSDDPSAPDIARILLPKPRAHFFTFGAEAKLDAPIFAFGNSGGGNVITKEGGTVKGVSANEVEIDAKVVPGNSGGPVVQWKDNIVVGLVTRAIAKKTDIWRKDTRYEGVRRFAVRPQSVAKWIPHSLEGLRTQERKLDAIHDATVVLAAVLYLHYYRDGIYAPEDKKGDYVIREIIATGSKTPIGSIVSAGISDLNTKLKKGSTTTVNMGTVQQTFGKFFATTFAAGSTDVIPTQRDQYIRFHRDSFEEEASLRKDILNELSQLAGKVQRADLITKAEADAIAWREAQRAAKP